MGHISSEMAALAFAGITIVFAVLALIAAVLALFKRIDDRWQSQEAAAREAASDREQTIDTTTLVLICAAAATAVGGRFQVRRIRRLLSPATKRTPWSSQGRISLLGSHAVHRNREHR